MGRGSTDERYKLRVLDRAVGVLAAPSNDRRHTLKDLSRKLAARQIK